MGPRHAGEVVVAHSVGSVNVVRGLSCSVARGIFPVQGWKLCLLLWQADSSPLDHQESSQAGHSYHDTTMPYSIPQWCLHFQTQGRILSSPGTLPRGFLSILLNTWLPQHTGTLLRPAFFSSHWLPLLGPSARASPNGSVLFPVHSDLISSRLRLKDPNQSLQSWPLHWFQKNISTAYLTFPLGSLLVLQDEHFRAENSWCFLPDSSISHLSCLTKCTTLTRLLRPQTTALLYLFLTHSSGPSASADGSAFKMRHGNASARFCLLPPCSPWSALQAGVRVVLENAVQPFPYPLQMLQWVSIRLQMKPKLHPWLRSSSQSGHCQPLPLCLSCSPSAHLTLDFVPSALPSTQKVLLAFPFSWNNVPCPHLCCLLDFPMAWALLPYRVCSNAGCCLTALLKWYSRALPCLGRLLPESCLFLACIPTLQIQGAASTQNSAWHVLGAQEAFTDWINCFLHNSLGMWWHLRVPYRGWDGELVKGRGEEVGIETNVNGLSSMVGTGHRTIETNVNGPSSMAGTGHRTMSCDLSDS